MRKDKYQAPEEKTDHSSSNPNAFNTNIQSKKTTYESNSLGLYPQTSLNIWATIRKHVVVNRKTTGQKDMHCWAT